jgi:uncharacterized membrane protein
VGIVNIWRFAGRGNRRWKEEFMIFFAALITLTLAAALASKAGVPGLANWPSRMRLALAAALWFFGTDHLLNIDRYLPMMPEFVPWPVEMVRFTGLCEIAGGVGLLVPRLRTLAGMMLAIYFVAVFPANIKNAVDGLSVDGLPTVSWYYWVRLLFQPIAIWWALYASEVIDWPRRRAASAAAVLG